MRLYYLMAITFFRSRAAIARRIRQSIFLLCAASLCGQPVVTTGANPGGSTVNVDIPGYFALQFGSGDANYGGTDYHGLAGFWDLKNDPDKQYNFAGMNAGLMEWQYGLNNADGKQRIYEYKEAPGTLTVLE